jgi:hypothetical protein
MSTPVTSVNDEWLSPTRQRRQQQPEAITITPITSVYIPSNPFEALLDSDTEAEAEEEEIVFVPEEDPEVVTAGEPRNEDDSSTSTASTANSIAATIDSFINSEEEMTTTLMSIDTMLEPADMKPFQGEYNLADTRLFRTRLGNVLANCVHNEHLAGHSHLIDTIEQYGERISNGGLTQVPILTPKQKLPLLTATSGEWKRYDILRKQYTTEEHWNAESLRVIERKFPAAILEKKNNFNALPLGFTARNGIDYIESKVDDVVSRQEAYNALLVAVAAMKYVSSPSGPIKFFSAMALIKRRFDILDVVDHPWKSIIVNCQTAVRQCGMDKSKSREIDTKWEMANLNKPVDTVWLRFTEFYIKELEFISKDGVGGAPDAAQTALLARLDDFESRHDGNMEIINDNQQQLGAAFSALSKPTNDSVPSFINTDASTVVTQANQSALKDLLSDFRKEIALMVAGGGVTGTGGGGGVIKAKTKHKEWRQWDKWCWTHGAHLTHNSANCEQKWRKDGHNEAATQSNPMKGNSKRDHLFMQWCSPVDNSAHATKGGA